jgi:type VI secretion system protein VasJ
VLGTIENGQNWHWAAFGKHPAAKDYFRLGASTPFFEGLFTWIEDGYQLLTTRENSPSDFCSWRFWSKEAGKESLVCGVIRVSSDSFGRPYPLVITGIGSLKNWQDNWGLLPFSCEKTWCQIEYLASNLFPDLKKLEEEIHTIRPPAAGWSGLTAKRKGLNEIGSPSDPYASFLDLRELKKLAVVNADKGEVFVSLDRGPCNDKIMRVSLWHLLFRESAPSVPNAVFMGGTLEKGYLAFFKRPLKSADFMQLWSVSSAGVGKNMIGTEFSMDLSELGRLPVSTDKPTGSDIRYDPGFDELQTEVDKLSSPALAGSVNWEKVCRFASDILMHKSKDLLVASYLAVALIYTRGNDGFAMGLRMYLELMEQFWDDLFPPRMRMRGRVRAVEWWVEKAETALKNAGDLSFPPDQLALIKENLNKLDIFLAEHLENAPSLAAVKDFFNALPGPEEEPARSDSPLRAVSGAPEEAPSVQAPTQTPKPETDKTAQVISSHQEAYDALSEGLNRIREAATYLSQRDPTAPHTYRLTRKAAWYGVEELPAAVNGRTKIPPPSTSEKNFLFDLRNKSDAEVLLKAAEARLPLYIFWIDLNRLSTEALSRLGSRYEKAHDAVCQETAFLLHRLPGLEELSFSDGTPFATPETRQWLEGIIFRGTPIAPHATASSDCAGDEAMEAIIEDNIEEIQLLIRKGKLIEAMEETQRKLHDCSSQRERLLWRLALAQMLVNVGKPKLALPHLDQVLRDIDRHELEEYDPPLAMRGFRLAWHALEAQAEQKFKDRATDVLHRIGRLDMPEMVRLAKG